MGYSTTAKHSMLAKLIGRTLPSDAVTHLSLHSADPGATGASETTAARIAVTEASWNALAGGVATLGADKAFTGGAASGACTHFGCWTALTAGTWLGGGPNTGDQAFNAAGEYTLKAGTTLNLNS